MKQHALRNGQLFIKFSLGVRPAYVEINVAGEPQYLVVFGPLGQVKGGVDLGSAQLAERRQLEGDRLGQAVTRLQLQLGSLNRDLVEVSEEIWPKLQFKRGQFS